MRDALFILVVIAVLLALSAIRYRRQIVALITFWKQFQAVRAKLKSDAELPRSTRLEPGIKLVNCARCGKWVPENLAVRHSSTTFVCMSDCRTEMNRS